MKIKKHLSTDDPQFKYKLMDIMDEIRYTFLDPMLLDITIETHKKSRTNLQNRYYWFIIQMIADELGYHRDAVHNYMKEMFLGYEEFDMPDGNTHKELKSTRDETTVSFEDYLVKIRGWADEFLNMYIPLPNETPYNYLEVK